MTSDDKTNPASKTGTAVKKRCRCQEGRGPGEGQDDVTR